MIEVQDTPVIQLILCVRLSSREYLMHAKPAKGGMRISSGGLCDKGGRTCYSADISLGHLGDDFLDAR